MKTFNDISKFLKFLFLFATVGSASMFICGDNDDLIQIKKTIANLSSSKKGFLKITSRMGGGARVKTISAFGYINEVDSSSIDNRRVIIGIEKVYSKEFENKYEGDLIPIWYDTNKDFIIARVYKSKEETINFLKDERENSINTQLKLCSIFMAMTILFYLMQLVSRED